MYANALIRSYSVIALSDGMCSCVHVYVSGRVTARASVCVCVCVRVVSIYVVGMDCIRGYTHATHTAHKHSRKPSRKSGVDKYTHLYCACSMRTWRLSTTPIRV